ncbi:MAG: diguanylate cyclase [Desulfuromonadaceae bacterium]|nr:diguanylate cyclase [Desulfuromonadaceae bacterium]
MNFNHENRSFRLFFRLLQFCWLLLAFVGLGFNIYQSDNEVNQLARQSASLEKERSDKILSWALHQGQLVTLDAEGEEQVLAPAQVLSQIQSLLPDKSVRSRLISPFPINAQNNPDSWELAQFTRLQLREVVKVDFQSETTRLYRELYPMIGGPRCLECHPDYGDLVVPGALSIQVPLAPIEAMLATKTISFNLACIFIWGLGTWALRLGQKNLQQWLVQRQRMQEELQSINNLYSALGAANQAMMRIETPQLLFQELCQIAVQYGQFQLACVSLLNSTTKNLSPVASAGDDGCQHYIKNVQVSTDPAYAEGRGPTSQAIRERRTVVTNDFLRELAGSPWEQQARAAGIRSSAVLPILCSEQELGALKIYAAEVGFFTPGHIELLERLRDDLCFALRSYDHKQRELKAQKELVESQKFNQVLLDALPYPAILARYSTRKVINANRRALEMGIRIGEPSPCCQIMDGQERRRAGTIEHQHEDGRWDMVCWRPVEGQDDDLYLHFAVDITDRKQQEEEVYTRAHTDPLTGIANRLYLNQVIQKAMDKSDDRGFSLLVVDLDRFKPVNDTHGHSVGDQVLIKVARRLKQVLRSQDVACRWGGDEFVLFLPFTDLDQAEKLRHRIIDVFGTPFKIGDIEIELSASVGFANYPEDGRTEGELFKLADKRMYRNKMGQIIPFPHGATRE